MTCSSSCGPRWRPGFCDPDCPNAPAQVVPNPELTRLSMEHLQETDALGAAGAFPEISYGDVQRSLAPRWRVRLLHWWIDLQNALELRVERARDLLEEMRARRRR